jgi:malonate transporter
VLLSNLADPILPIFMAMLLGYGMRLTRFFDVPTAQAINRFVFYVAMPALIFKLVSSMALSEVDWPATWTYLGTEAVVYIGVALAVKLIFGRPAEEALLIGMAAGFVNHLMFILPIAQSLHGDAAAKPIAALVFIDIFVFCLSIFAMDLLKARSDTSSGAYGFKNVSKMLVKNPIVIATALGLFASLNRGIMPTGVWTYAHFAGAAAAPAALFALGVTLADQPLRPLGAMAWTTVGVKLLIHPALFALASSTITMQPTWQQLGFLVAAGPCGAMPFVIALQYGIKTTTIAKAVLVSTVLSLFSLSYLTA